MFTGFTPETIDFLWGIRMNNNRDWFLEHKKQYVSTLYEPMKALGKDLFAPFMEIPGTILKVSRIYRRLRPTLPGRAALSASATRTWGTKCSARSWKTKWRTSSPSSRRCTRISPGSGCKTAL